MLLEGTRPLAGEERAMIAALGADGLQRISGSPARSDLPRAAQLPARLVKASGFLRREILSLLAEVEAGEDRHVAGRCEEEGPCSLRIFIRPAGSRTGVYDRSSWGPTEDQIMGNPVTRALGYAIGGLGADRLAPDFGTAERVAEIVAGAVAEGWILERG